MEKHDYAPLPATDADGAHPLSLPSSPRFSRFNVRHWSRTRILVVALTVTLVIIAAQAVFVLAHYSSIFKAAPKPDFTKTMSPQMAVKELYERQLESLEQILPRGSNKNWNRQIFHIWLGDDEVDIDPEIHDSWNISIGWKQTVIREADAQKIVEETLAQVSTELYDLWHSIKLQVVRSDFTRYLLLYLYGGVYADTDVECLTPVNDWLTADLWARKELEIVAGIEIDAIDGVRWAWTRPYGLAQYVMLARPLSRVMRSALVNAALRIQGLADHQKVSIPDIDWTSMDSVGLATGPPLFTTSVIENLWPAATSEEDAWQNIAHAQEPVFIRPALILPIGAFGSGQGHSNSPEYYSDEALVQHHWHGNWVDSGHVKLPPRSLFGFRF